MRSTSSRALAPFVALFLSITIVAGDGNRLTYLDGSDPFYVGLDFPRLTTAQWVGESNVDAVVVLAIDDMRSYEKYEEYLRPILERLKELTGSAPVSIMTNRVDPTTPHFQRWLAEGVTIECHTLDHPCPILKDGDFARAKATYDGSVDQLFSVAGNHPVAFRVPCMDSINSPSPRFYTEIFNQTTAAGNFLRLDSSVCNLTTAADPELPRQLVFDDAGNHRFESYIPFPSFVNIVENYPYPFVIDRKCWQFPCVIPSDWEGQNRSGNQSPTTVETLKAQLDVAVIKKGTFTLVFHPYEWIKNSQIVELIDHAASNHGDSVRFLNFRSAWNRLRDNLLGGVPLRADDGGDNGVRVLDVDADGYVDVVIGNGSVRQTRLWSPETQSWTTGTFPLVLSELKKGERVDGGARFGILQPSGHASVVVSNEQTRGAWHFNGTGWQEDTGFFRGFSIDGEPVHTSWQGRDLGVRLRDIDADGICEILVSNPSRQAIFKRSPDGTMWERLPFTLPPATQFVDTAGGDGGLRFADFNEDGRDDVIFANEAQYSLHLFESHETGWSIEVLNEQRRDHTVGDVDIPPISRGGRNAGAWFRSRHLWVQNEFTSDLPNHVERRSYNDLLRTLTPQPLEPQEALSAFHIHDGFRIELMASEPLVRDPVSFDWDTNGNLLVVEMHDYPEGTDGEGKAGGRIVVLRDTDGDEVLDTSSVFVDGLSFPTGARPWRDGVLVTTVPDIVFAVDRSGDGKADVVETLYTGFGHGNEQHLVNGFAWGLDNWLYCANGDSSGIVRSKRTGKEIDIRGHDFRIRPDEGLLELVAGQTQFGRTRNDWGDWFGSNNPNPIFHFALESRFLRRNPMFSRSRSRHVLYPRLSRVYPTSRTLPRVNMPHEANRFTSCCGLTLRRDDAFGPQFENSAFVSEPAHNLVHRIELEPQGATFRGGRPTGDQGREFLASSDNWFRPTKLRYGPDGALWIADMYREVIEHPQYFYIEGFEDVNARAGEDLGRLYRIVPVNYEPRPIPTLGSMNAHELAAQLGSPSGWVRDMAHQLLVEQQATEVTEHLRERVGNSSNPRERLHALCVLDGIGKLDVKLVKIALDDSHPAVRRHAVRLAEKAIESTEALGAALLAKLSDPDPHVQLQAIYRLGDWNSPKAGTALAALFVRHSDDEFLASAIESSASTHLEPMLAAALQETTNDALRERFLPMALRLSDDRPDLSQKIIEHLTEPGAAGFSAWQYRGAGQAAKDLADQLERGAELSQQARRRLNAMYERGLDVARQTEAPEELRQAALSFVGRGARLRRQQDSGEELAAADLNALSEMVNPQTPPAIQRAVIESLGEFTDVQATATLLRGWRRYTPQLKRQVGGILLRRAEWAERFLDAIDADEVKVQEIDAVQRRWMMRYDNETIRTRAKKLFVSTASADRQKVVDRFKNADVAAASRERGLVVFDTKCSPCHNLAGRGHSVGPDLALLTDRSTPALLVAIFDPNRGVEEKYTQYNLVTRDGRVWSGIFADESGGAITLLGQDRQRFEVARSDIVSAESAGISLMPEGLEEGLSDEDVADLLAFIQRPPPAPKVLSGNRPRVLISDRVGPIALEAETAELYGPTLRFSARKKSINRWRSDKDHALWRIRSTAAAKYDVLIDAVGAGDFTISSNTEQALQLSVSAADAETTKSRPAGTLKLSAGVTVITLHADAPSTKNELHVRRISLVPATE